MRILVTGGTGFIGRAVCRALGGEGHTVTIVSRDPEHAETAAVGWEGVPTAVAESDALVNLAGEPIAGGRWSDARKRQIHDSRVVATQRLIDAIAAAPRRPAVLVSASAVGYYGPHGDEPLDETAAPGNDFLARVCRAWEEVAQRAEEHGVRVVRLRLGIVLAGDGGALQRMLLPFRVFLGGPIGDGRQWMSWIHRDDVTGLVVEALRRDTYRGAVNASAPVPVTNREFAQTLGRVLARPALLPVPAAVLRLVFGEMADALLSGQRVRPEVAERLGYRWRYRELAAALHASARR